MGVVDGMFLPPQNSSVETVLPNVMVFEGGTFEEEQLGLD